MTTPVEQFSENTQNMTPEPMLPITMATRADRAAALASLRQLIIEDLGLTVELI